MDELEDVWTGGWDLMVCTCRTCYVADGFVLSSGLGSRNPVYYDGFLIE